MVFRIALFQGGSFRGPPMYLFENRLTWKRHLGDGSRRNREQRNFVIISGYSVCFDSSALHTPMDKSPFSLGSAPYTYRLHLTSAARSSIPRSDIQMKAPKTVGAMVAVGRSVIRGRNPATATRADERFRVVYLPFFRSRHIFLTTCKSRSVYSVRTATDPQV